MIRTLAAWWRALLAMLTISCAGTAWTMDAPPGTGLPAGPAIIVVTPDTVRATTVGSEAYGDWDSYRQAFLAGKPAGLAHVPILWSRFRRLAPRTALENGFATLFVRPDGTALLHRGMVLEPQIYVLGSDWALHGARPTPPASSGLVRTTLPARR